jgi:hypothetical protein
MSWRFQFSLRTILLVVTGLAISLAMLVQVPHVFIFIVCAICAVVASLAAYRFIKNFRPRIGFVFVAITTFAASIAVWTLFYVLSLGPFITFCEMERTITGQHHLGRLADVYRPALRLSHLDFFRLGFFRWYVAQWIPPDAVGLPALYPTKISQELVGTWQTGGTQVVNLRSDGTGRAYGSLTTSDVLYCEWASDASELAIYQYASKRSASAWLGCVVMNAAPTDCFRVIELSADHFTLRDKTGRIISLTRSHDNKLESAP